MNDSLLSFLKNQDVPFEENVPISEKSWIKTGGVCNYWISPRSVPQLKSVCVFLYRSNISFDLVGQTSNIFFHSRYNPEVVVSTVKANQYKLEDNVLTCECGCNVMRIAKEMLAEGYAGFYGLVGLPGTIASAVVNNAGCFNCSISSMLTSAEVLMSDGSVKIFTKKDFGYEKRSSIFKRGECKGVLLSIKLELHFSENIEEEYKKSEATKKYRKTHQEGPGKNLGSIYAKMRMRINVKNVIAIIMAKIAGVNGQTKQKLMLKRMLLLLYGYKDLHAYISDRQINTFVWIDNNAEQKFIRYKEFMAKVFSGLKIEIEERQ